MLLQLLIWILIYTLVLASSQVLLKLGLIQIGAFGARGIKDIIGLLFLLIRNPYVVSGTVLMASSYFLWLAILSWFKLSIAFPMTALGFIFVAILSYFILGERLFYYNYIGVLFIAFGIFLLLYRHI